MGSKCMYLGLPEAKYFSEHNPPFNKDGASNFIDLSFYSQADPMAIQFLANQGYKGFVLFGLTDLDIEAASLIADWNAHFIFKNLGQLKCEAAVFLSKCDQGLIIKGLREIDAAVAAELAKKVTSLSISCSGGISIEAVNEFVKHNHELCVTVAVSPPMYVQRALLLGYVGREVLLKFTVESEIANRAFYNMRQIKSIKIGSHTDDAGQLWQIVTATEEMDRWLSRLSPELTG